MTDLVVPWNASWTSERRFEIRPCRWAQGKLAVWQSTSPGDGRPIFAKPHVVRQRMSIMRMICTVCGQPTPAADRWWFALGEPVEQWFATTEAPVHRKCGELAMEVCPHIRRGDHRVNFSPLPPGHQIMMVTVGGAQFEKDFGLKTCGREVVGGLKLCWPRTAIRFKD